MLNSARGSPGIITTIVAIAAVIVLGGCSRTGASMHRDKVRAFATDYANAWSSQEAAKVADHFTPGGSLKINDGAASIGRAAITGAAQSFMTAFPDMVVAMDSVRVEGSQTVFHWTLTGTNTGPNGSGKAVRFSGYEEWTLGDGGLILNSLGHFDQAEYERQLQHGVSSK